MQITCAEKEYAHLNPPSGQTCGNYLDAFISARGGYITNPDATSACSYCSSATTDQFLGPTFNIYYSTHWRDFGIFCAFIIFNVSLLAYYGTKTKCSSSVRRFSLYTA